MIVGMISRYHRLCNIRHICTQKNWNVATKWSNKAGERGAYSIDYSRQYYDTPNNTGAIFSLTCAEKFCIHFS